MALKLVRQYDPERPDTAVVSFDYLHPDNRGADSYAVHVMWNWQNTTEWSFQLYKRGIFPHEWNKIELGEGEKGYYGWHETWDRIERLISRIVCEPVVIREPDNIIEIEAAHIEIRCARKVRLDDMLAGKITFDEYVSGGK